LLNTKNLTLLSLLAARRFIHLPFPSLPNKYDFLCEAGSPILSCYHYEADSFLLDFSPMFFFSLSLENNYVSENLIFFLFYHFYNYSHVYTFGPPLPLTPRTLFKSQITLLAHMTWCYNQVDSSLLKHLIIIPICVQALLESSLCILYVEDIL
jgi:hypothetical protein